MKTQIQNNSIKLPKDIRSIIVKHGDSLFIIGQWLKEIGCDIPWHLEERERIDRITDVTIEVSRTNYYDKLISLKDKVFNVSTFYYINVMFSAADFGTITKKLEAYSSIKPKNMKHILLHFLPHERNLEAVDLYPNSLSYELKFSIYHAI